DIIFLGMKNVPEAEAKYLIAGSNSGRAEGRVVRKIDKVQVFAKAYTGSNLRASTHALADGIAQALGLVPIAQTKIAFKIENGDAREIYIADYDGHSAQEVTHDGA